MIQMPHTCRGTLTMITGGRDMEKERITHNTSAMNMIQILSENKPEAMLIVMDLLRESKKIDPSSNALGGFGSLYDLDSCGIYGSRIEQLHNEICGGDLTRTVACLRATQLMLVSPDDLNRAIDNEGKLDVDDIMTMVKEKLPSFALNYTVKKPQANDNKNCFQKCLSDESSITISEDKV